MGKKQKKVTQQKQYTSQNTESSTDNGLNLRSLLDENVLNKLKNVADTMKQEQDLIQQKQAEAEAVAKKAEQKRLEQDFAYLLEQSDPKAHKYK